MAVPCKIRAEKFGKNMDKHKVRAGKKNNQDMDEQARCEALASVTRSGEEWRDSRLIL
jgi:hypothetical protein